MTERHGDRPDTPVNEPAPTVTSKWRSDEWIELDRRQRGAPPLDPRQVPSPTLTGAAIGKGIWVVRTGTNSMKHSRDPEETVVYERDVTEPAPTIDTKAIGAWKIERNDQTGTDEIDRDWPLHRPATTIASRDLVADPGANANRFNGAEKSRNDGIKITEEDALILQSFRPDYPLQGSRSKRFEQVGNAVPPVLAAAVLRGLV